MEKKERTVHIRVPKELKGLLDNLKTGDESYQSVIKRLVSQVKSTYDEITKEEKNVG